MTLTLTLTFIVTLTLTVRVRVTIKVRVRVRVRAKPSRVRVTFKSPGEAPVGDPVNQSLKNLKYVNPSYFSVLGLPFYIVSMCDADSKVREFLTANFGPDSDAPAYLRPICMYTCLREQISRRNCELCSKGCSLANSACNQWRRPPKVGIICFPCQPFSQQRTTGEDAADPLLKRGKRRKRCDGPKGPVPPEQHPLFYTMDETVILLANRLYDIAICEQVRRFGSKFSNSALFASQSPMDYFMSKVNKIRDAAGKPFCVAMRSLKIDSLLFGESGRPRPACKFLTFLISKQT